MGRPEHSASTNSALQHILNPPFSYFSLILRAEGDFVKTLTKQVFIRCLSHEIPLFPIHKSSLKVNRDNCNCIFVIWVSFWPVSSSRSQETFCVFLPLGLSADQVQCDGTLPLGRWLNPSWESSVTMTSPTTAALNRLTLLLTQWARLLLIDA